MAAGQQQLHELTGPRGDGWQAWEHRAWLQADCAHWPPSSEPSEQCSFPSHTRRRSRQAREPHWNSELRHFWGGPGEEDFLLSQSAPNPPTPRPQQGCAIWTPPFWEGDGCLVLAGPGGLSHRCPQGRLPSVTAPVLTPGLVTAVPAVSLPVTAPRVRHAPLSAATGPLPGATEKLLGATVLRRQWLHQPHLHSEPRKGFSEGDQAGVARKRSSTLCSEPEKAPKLRQMFSVARVWARSFRKIEPGCKAERKVFI